MNYSVFDIETNGLLHKEKGKPQATKIHCMSVHRVRDGVVEDFTLTDYNDMIHFLWTEECIVGHNILRFDVPVLEKFLKVDLSWMRQIDTLALSWYLYPNREKHGLELWGEDLGIAKPKVEDWENDTIEVYIDRCQEDVKINVALFDMQIKYLKELYEDSAGIDKCIDYLCWKLKVAREQEEQRWKLDIDKCTASLEKLQQEFLDRKEKLADLMPKKINYKKVSRPKVCLKKDGSPSVHGINWLETLRSLNLPDYHVGTVKVPISEERGNPGSHQQLKDWLFSLGWEPQNYKLVKNKKTKEVKSVPQLTNKDGDDICYSVKDLYEKVPELEVLEGFFVIKHRIGILEGFLKNVDNEGYVKAQVTGFTNTLRFQHTTIVNLPTIPKPYWEEVRGCLITDEGYELCGSDMSSLEDNTKQHYMYFFDPEYVRIMRTPGFDPHLYMAVQSKALSYDEMEFYKYVDKKKDGKEYNYYPPPEGVNPIANSCLEGAYRGLHFNALISLEPEEQAKIMKIIKPIRLKSKKVNFAAVYGAGAPKLALTASIPLSEAKQLHTAYWVVNRSVKQVANACKTKTVGKQMWLFNPVSRLWYSLREEKDKFSTLNQGTGVWCFDTWIRHVRKQGIKLVAQFHDEKVSRVKLGTREEHTIKLKQAIQWTNEELRLNVPLSISIDYGHSYADIH